MILEKLRIIAKAKFSNKENLGDWYQDRLDICRQCPLLSTNKENWSVKEATMVAANFGAQTCLACGCGITAKNSVRGEECGLVKIGQEPLWGKLPEIQAIDFNDFKFENLSSDKVRMTLDGNIKLGYGSILENSDSHISISLKDKFNKTIGIKAYGGCTCTIPVVKKTGDTFYVDITYNTKLVGGFSKNITLLVDRGKEKFSIKVEINGIVKPNN